MSGFLRALLAVLLGLVLGSVVNMGLLELGGRLIPLPEGADTSTLEGLKAALPLFEPRHFLPPLLAHALGTLVGALIAGLLAARGARAPSFVVGGLFLLGGISMVVMVPSPLWFSAADLLLAYLPMAWLGYALSARLRTRPA